MENINLLEGVWQIDPSDTVAIERYGQASLDFRSNGELVYSVDLGDKVQQSLLTYKVVGDKLITNQPSYPREEITRYELSNKKLVLHYRNVRATFLRTEVSQKA